MDIGTTISHYKILEKLGEGGMGVVYKAHDTKLDREVALKFLLDHIAQSKHDKKRFLQEARAASAIDHPNICTIHEISETPDGQLYMVMPAYEGKTLNELVQSGPLEQDKALDIVLQVCKGLKAAHSKGIIHRDIKCSNLFVTEQGRVIIMDFGLARSRDVTQLTQEGATIGTVLYMSPEQARGDDLDNRTDIWSLGVVLYELLSGDHPFFAEYDQAMIYRILNEEPKSISQLRPEISEPVEKIVFKCLQKDRDSRYPSIKELEADLLEVTSTPARSTHKHTGGSGMFEKLAKPVPIISSFIATALVAFSLVWILGSSPVIPFEERDWVLIADFKNETGNELFTRSLDTALEASLGQSMHINIFPDQQLSAVLKRMEVEEPIEIDENLGIEICIREGINGLVLPQISRVGDMYQLSVRLIDPASSLTVRSYVENVSNENEILPALDDIIRDIRTDLGESLLSVQTTSREIFRVTTPSLQALKYYSDGVYNWGEGNYEEATRLQHLALEHDSTFASAHTSLGIQYSSYIYNDRVKGRNHFEKAIQYSESASERERLFIRASYQRFLGNTEEAEELYRLYLDSYPDDWRVRFNLARIYMTSERPEMAITEFEKVLDIIPDEAGTIINIATSHLIANNYPLAIENYNKAFSINPDFYSSPTIMHEYGVALARNNMIDEARAVYNQLLDTGNRARGLRSLALLDMYEGKYREAQIKLNDAILGDQANDIPISEARDRINLAILHLDSESPEEMKEELESAHQLLEAISPQAWLYRYIPLLFARAGYMEEALAGLDVIKEITDPDLPYDRSLRLFLEGEIELANGQYSIAIQNFTQSISINGNEDAKFSLALTHYLAGNYEESTELYSTILENSQFGLERQTDWLWAFYYCADAHAMLGQQNQAIQKLDQLLDLWSDADPGLELAVVSNRLRETL